jgi:hypothetical protein
VAQLAVTTLCGVVAGLATITCANRSFAAEPGNFQQTLEGVTINAPLAAAPPAGLYAVMDTFIAPSAVGTGQNLGTTVSAPLWAPELFWSTGYHILGADLSMLVVQPFFDVAAYPTNESGPPFAGAVWFTNVHNTLFTPILASWDLGNFWHASAGFTFIPPNGSRYNGTNNPDYWTYEPRVALAYLGTDWNLTANFKYDINTASAGHTGLYQVVAGVIPVPAVAAMVASIGRGYTTGQEAFLDLASTRKYGNWEVGPVASLKWQTTADTPGSGFTCTQVTAFLGPTLSCGTSTHHSVGGLVAYTFKSVPIKLEVWATDSVYTRDAFGGWGAFTRLTVPIWSNESHPSKAIYPKGPQ